MIDKVRQYAIPRWSVVPELRNATAGYGCTFSCTLAEAYAVLSVSRPEEAPLLLALGARTAEEGEAILRERDRADLIRANPWTAEAAERGIPFEPTLEFLTDTIRGKSPEDFPHFLDGLEAYGIRCLREMRNTVWSVSDRVLAGKLRLSDIKAVGASRLAKASRRSDTALEFLVLGPDGEPMVPAATVRALIVRFEDAAESGERPKANPLDLARLIGVDAVLALQDTDKADTFVTDLYRQTEWRERFDTDYLGRLAAYNESLGFRVRFRASDVRMLFDSGASRDDVFSGLEEGHALRQIAGMAEGVAPAVSGGFL